MCAFHAGRVEFTLESRDIPDTQLTNLKNFTRFRKKCGLFPEKTSEKNYGIRPAHVKTLQI